MEICNNIIDFEELPGVYNCERYWDIVNAFRCLHGDPLIFATAGDDAHRYDPARVNGLSGIGSAWVMVYCPGEFTVDNILAAYNKGEYYPTTGVLLDTIRFDEKTGKLFVRAAGEEKFTIRFITTKKNFDTAETQEYFPWIDDFDRQLRKYGKDIGLCVKEFSGVGEAEYTMAPDDLYVRAEVISNRPGRFEHFPYPPREMAWTQPFRK